MSISDEIATMMETDQETNLEEPTMTPEMWAENFFGPNTIDIEIAPELFDHDVYGIKVLYNPDSCINQALMPSHFDLQSYTPTKKFIRKRSCSNLFQGAHDMNERTKRVGDWLRYLHDKMQALGILNSFPKDKQGQRANMVSPTCLYKGRSAGSQ